MFSRWMLITILLLPGLALLVVSTQPGWLVAVGEQLVRWQMMGERAIPHFAFLSWLIVLMVAALLTASGSLLLLKRMGRRGRDAS